MFNPLRLSHKTLLASQQEASSHAIQKTQQETKTKGKGPEPNTNNHKTATQALREEPLMPAQNQSNQTNSKPSHYTTGQIQKKTAKKSALHA